MTQVKTYTSKGKTYSYYRPTKWEIDSGVRPFRVDGLTPSQIKERVGWVGEKPTRKRREQVVRSYLRDEMTNLFNRAKKRARNKGWGFSITEEDVIQALERANYRCEVTGTQLTLNGGRGRDRCPTDPSLDRIDSKRGYSPDNIRIVCFAANVGMLNWGEEQYQRIAARSARFKRARKLDNKPKNSIITSRVRHKVEKLSS